MATNPFKIWNTDRPKAIAEFGGYAGMALLQGATLPQMINALFYDSADLAPLSMVLMVWIGLLLYLIRVVYQRDVLYMISNGIGVVLNMFLMILIIWGG